jgi:DNA-binding response OmpR family regulator
MSIFIPFIQGVFFSNILHIIFPESNFEESFMPLERKAILKHQVLFIEDDPIQQKVIGTMLFQLGYTIDVVGNAKDGISRLRDKIFNLVVLDLGLPDLPGEVVIDAVRKCTRNSDALIIVISAHADRIVQERCFHFGADAFFVKPIYMDNLEKIIYTSFHNKNTEFV